MSEGKMIEFLDGALREYKRDTHSCYMDGCSESENKIKFLKKQNAELRQAIKSLRELAIDLWENDASETDWEDVERFHELIDKAETLAKYSERGED